MDNEFSINVNGETKTVHAAPDTPLLYVLRNELGLNGPQFGCGLEQCGACMVLLGAKAISSCHVPISECGRTPITTLEGLSVDGELHPIQQAFIEQQAAQCGYCSNGMMVKAAELLWRNSHPTDEQVCTALNDNLCRCGTHLRIVRAVKQAADLLYRSEE